MALGKRIHELLQRPGWDRKRLLDAVPGLTPQALSNLIRRDSRRSEWDEQLAQALGVSVTWLVYGRDDYQARAKVIPLQAAEPPAMSGLLSELVALARGLDERGQTELIGQARMLANLYPAKANAHK